MPAAPFASTSTPIRGLDPKLPTGEFSFMVRQSVPALHMKGIAAALGNDKQLTILTDASAARGVLMRQGVGKVRHLQVKQLWLQELVANEDMTVQKIPRHLNVSDALTHGWTAAENRFWSGLGIQYIPRAFPRETTRNCARRRSWFEGGC